MADFKIAVALTLQHEGGFQDEHNDRGNWTGGQVGVGELKGTKYGISAAEYPDLDIKNLTPEQATTIYQEGYWKEHYGGIANQAIANKLFDLGVLFGVGVAAKILQSVIGAQSDGDFGPLSVETVNGLTAGAILQAYKTAFVNHSLAICRDNPLERSNFAGWVARINS